MIADSSLLCISARVLEDLGALLAAEFESRRRQMFTQFTISLLLIINIILTASFFMIDRH